MVVRLLIDGDLPSPVDTDKMCMLQLNRQHHTLQAAGNGGDEVGEEEVWDGIFEHEADEAARRTPRRVNACLLPERRDVRAT